MPENPYEPPKGEPEPGRTMLTSSALLALGMLIGAVMLTIALLLPLVRAHR